MQQNALRGLYLDELRDLYSAENQLVKALPKMAKSATSPDLKAGFEKPSPTDNRTRFKTGNNLRRSRRKSEGKNV